MSAEKVVGAFVLQSRLAETVVNRPIGCHGCCRCNGRHKQSRPWSHKGHLGLVSLWLHAAFKKKHHHLRYQPLSSGQLLLLLTDNETVVLWSHIFQAVSVNYDCMREDAACFGRFT